MVLKKRPALDCCSQIKHSCKVRSLLKHGKSNDKKNCETKYHSRGEKNMKSFLLCRRTNFSGTIEAFSASLCENKQKYKSVFTKSHNHRRHVVCICIYMQRVHACLRMCGCVCRRLKTSMNKANMSNDWPKAWSNRVSNKLLEKTRKNAA